MESFVFALNAVLPLIAMAFIGYLLVRIGFLPDGVSKLLNKMVFRIFLPCMLFYNVYKIDSLAGISLGYVAYAVAAVLIVFALAIPIAMCITKDGTRRGVVMQAMFRSNFALIGIPLSVMGIMRGEDILNMTGSLLMDLTSFITLVIMLMALGRLKKLNGTAAKSE